MTLEEDTLPTVAPPYVEDRMLAAVHANSASTQPSELLRLAEHPDPWVARAVATRHTLDMTVMARLALREDSPAAVVLASRPDLPDDVALILAQHPDPAVLVALMHRDWLPQSVYSVLSDRASGSATEQDWSAADVAAATPSQPSRRVTSRRWAPTSPAHQQ